ncbi:MAG: TRAP transporter small permease [Rhodospirillales bacterium]|jgi:TRAP-type C4-dicarboxylate transport system permease small subunit|nr:TRAP transporter small permease [Rhodospirillales bacterium]
MSEQDQEILDTMEFDEIMDAPIEWRKFGVEDYIVFFIFWVLAADIFLQFFTRYVLNSSLAWTEEIARYLLIAVGFVGSIMCVRKNSHIMVEFLYRFIPPMVGRILVHFIDVLRIGFFAMLTLICYRLAGKTHQMMVSIDFPKSAMYYLICVCLAGMAVRSVQVAFRHVRQGGSKISLEHARHVTSE